MTKDDVFNKLKLMYDYADQGDLKDSLYAAMNTIDCLDLILKMACDSRISDEEFGKRVRKCLMLSYEEVLKEEEEE